MPTFAFVVRDQQGKEIPSSQSAKNEETLRRGLEAQGYEVVSIVRTKAVGAKRAKASMFKRVKLDQLAQWCRQFATMINAGVSLIRCLTVLQEQTTNPNLRVITRDVRDEVEGGNTLSGAMTKYQRTFSNLAIGLVRAGEVGGVLDETMNRVAEFMEKDQALKSKIKSAMAYPTIVFMMTVVMVTFMLVFVLPTFKAMFEGLGAQLPKITLIVVNLSNLLRNYWFLWIAGGIGFIILFKWYTKTPRGMFQLHTVQLKLPVFGDLNKKVIVSRFSRTLGTLLTSGVPVMQALEVTGKASGNKVVEKAVDEVRVSIREGESISVPMENSGIFPPMVTQMIAVGEETGSLDSMLKKISDFYDMEVEATLDALTSLLEPLLMVFMGAAVGFIVVALVGAAAEMASAFSAARKNRLDLSVGIALGSASQIALFVAPVMVLLSYFVGPQPMNLQFWPGAVVMILIAAMTAALVTNSGRSTWFVGVVVLMVYLIFAMTLYLLPPRVQ